MFYRMIPECESELEYLYTSVQSLVSDAVLKEFMSNKVIEMQDFLRENKFSLLPTLDLVKEVSYQSLESPSNQANPIIYVYNHNLMGLHLIPTKSAEIVFNDYLFDKLNYEKLKKRFNNYAMQMSIKVKKLYQDNQLRAGHLVPITNLVHTIDTLKLKHEELNSLVEVYNCIVSLALIPTIKARLLKTLVKKYAELVKECKKVNEVLSETKTSELNQGA